MQTTRTQSIRSHGQAEPPSPDLSIGRHLGGEDRRSSSESSVAAARRHSRQVSRERGEERVSEGGEGGSRSESTEPLVRLDQLAWCRQVGLAWPVGQGWQCEREVRECF
jgi:hypothetical protein